MDAVSETDLIDRDTPAVAETNVIGRKKPNRSMQTAKCVLMTLAQHAHDDGTEARPSCDTIARKWQITRRSVLTALAWLERHGYVTPVGPRGGGRGRGSTVTYRICLDMLERSVKDVHTSTSTKKCENRADKCEIGAKKCENRARKCEGRSHESVRNRSKRDSGTDSDRTRAAHGRGADNRRSGRGGGGTTTSAAAVRVKEDQTTALLTPVRDAQSLAQAVAVEVSPKLRAAYAGTTISEWQLLWAARRDRLRKALSADEREVLAAEDAREGAAWEETLEHDKRIYYRQHTKQETDVWCERKHVWREHERNEAELQRLRIFISEPYRPPAPAKPAPPVPVPPVQSAPTQPPIPAPSPTDEPDKPPPRTLGSMRRLGMPPPRTITGSTTTESIDCDESEETDASER